MTIKVYNTLSRQKEILEPLNPGKIRMYVCGPTVYDSCHIGHARSVVVFDVIYRYFKARGYDVFYVRNFTDVDDKIINRARSLGMSPDEVARKYINEFHEDMVSLNMRPPDLEPLATAHIPQIIRIVKILEKKGYAYSRGGDVFFSVNRWPEYGKLSGRRLDDMEAGARVEVDPRKENPFDFVLWKASKPGEPAWDSPWGRGRPGWHIECSAMSAQYLGETFDIHGGGKDLIFPHHENEIAQSEAAFGKSFVRYWIHNGFININQEKMSKSLGNFLMVKDIVRAWHPEAMRLFLLSNHYRSPLDYTEQAMYEAASGLEKIYGLLLRIADLFDKWPPGPGLDKNLSETSSGELWERFCDAMDDDFNTARGIGVLFEAVRLLNRELDERGSAAVVDDTEGLCTIRDMMRIGDVLGIMAQNPGGYFEQHKEAVLESGGIDEDWIESRINERAEARKAKDFARADAIRDELKELNIVLEDRPEGTVWKHGDGKA
ncbi:MAG: cysteine--tRNA ligase [Desulfobacteraceae bacterium]|nr:cysteine--tRNA ligase [Desulfobacteraceae bacterium]MCF8094195.1 cysteine--tRNA ligase [Desulfobacteraceae bacterium]